jgi:L-2,4-diaminobutyrate decarboxylase
MSEYDNGMVTFECTKRSAALGLWGTFAIFGTQLFEELVDQVFAMAKYLAGLITESDQFALFLQPTANIVVFRYLPQGSESASDQQLSQLQLRLRREMLESGFAYLTQTCLDGQIYLRCTIMNPLTDRSHLDQIVSELTRLGPSNWRALTQIESAQN